MKSTRSLPQARRLARRASRRAACQRLRGITRDPLAPLGRRTSKTTLNNNGSGQGETPMTATCNGANRMSAISLQMGGQTQTYHLSYDAQGNLTQKQHASNASDTTQYSWDASNRLVQITQAAVTATGKPSLNASYQYDAFGRRIQATLQMGSNAPQTVQYLYEGSQALGEIRNGNLSHHG